MSLLKIKSDKSHDINYYKYYNFKVIIIKYINNYISFIRFLKYRDNNNFNIK